MSTHIYVGHFSFYFDLHHTFELRHRFSCIPCSMEIILYSYKYTWHQSVSVYHKHITKCEDETKKEKCEALHIIQFPSKLNENTLVVSKHISWLKMQWRELNRLLFSFDFTSFFSQVDTSLRLCAFCFTLLVCNQVDLIIDFDSLVYWMSRDCSRKANWIRKLPSDWY